MSPQAQKHRTDAKVIGEGTLEEFAAFGITCREVPADHADRRERDRVRERNRRLRGTQILTLTRQANQARHALPAARRTPAPRPAARRPRASSGTRSDPGDPDPEPAPKHVRRFARACGIDPSQVRWCHARDCTTVGFAVDDHQRAALDAAGFDRLCPLCRGAA